MEDSAGKKQQTNKETKNVDSVGKKKKLTKKQRMWIVYVKTTTN